ncbi:hypothetical protein VPHK567_0078 [Vibrio phage K567]
MREVLDSYTKVCADYRIDLNEISVSQSDYYIVQLYAILVTLGFAVETIIFWLFVAIVYAPIALIGGWVK